MKQNRMKIHKRLGLGLIVIGVLVGTLGMTALADGAGSPEVCKTGDQADNGIFTAEAGEIVDGVCIKSGELHTGVLGNGLHRDGCYEVSGVGTQTVTVQRVGNPGPDCQQISHVDVLVTDDPEPTTTTVPEETTTVPEETTTTVPEETTTTDPATTTTAPETTTTDPATTVPTTTPTELPDTGINASSWIVAALVLLMSGGLVLLGVTRRAEKI